MKGKLCVGCADRFVNREDVKSIKKSGRCVFCLKNKPIKVTSKRIVDWKAYTKVRREKDPQYWKKWPSQQNRTKTTI